MFSVIWEWLKGLFGAKGTSQIGSRNQSVSGVTVGDNVAGVTIGNQVNIYHPPQPPTPRKILEIEPTPEVDPKNWTASGAGIR
jgi:hypothetical protein